MSSSGHIVAIGGGEIADEETRAIDEHILDTVPETPPSVLFLPTGSGDSDGYIETFEEYYSSLGAAVRSLELTASEVTAADAREAIDEAEIIYVGGGDTGYLVDTLQSYGLTESLRTHFESGGTLSGLSAGALCWFAYGLSDAMALDQLDYGPVTGLGLISETHLTVHADYRRRATFLDYLRARSVDGVALTDCAAIEFNADLDARILRCSDNSFACHVDPGRSPAVRLLPEQEAFVPLEELIAAGTPLGGDGLQ